MNGFGIRREKLYNEHGRQTRVNGAYRCNVVVQGDAICLAIFNIRLDFVFPLLCVSQDGFIFTSWLLTLASDKSYSNVFFFPSQFRPSIVCLSVCHTSHPRQNGSKYQNAACTVRCPDVWGFFLPNFVVICFGSHPKQMCWTCRRTQPISSKIRQIISDISKTLRSTMQVIIMAVHGCFFAETLGFELTASNWLKLDPYMYLEDFSVWHYSK